MAVGSWLLQYTYLQLGRQRRPEILHFCVALPCHALLYPGNPTATRCNASTWSTLKNVRSAPELLYSISRPRLLWVSDFRRMRYGTRACGNKMRSAAAINKTLNGFTAQSFVELELYICVCGNVFTSPVTLLLHREKAGQGEREPDFLSRVSVPGGRY